MGSIESLSSHSSEQNSTTKSASSQPREKSGGIPWIASPPSSNGQKSSGLWTTSPESSSKEDATKTDVESDCQSVASVTGPENMSPPIDLTKKGPYGLTGLKRSAASSLRSIPSAEGKSSVFLEVVLAGYLVQCTQEKKRSASEGYRGVGCQKTTMF